MRDIAGELRLMLKIFRTDPRNAELIGAAADEIERLREVERMMKRDGLTQN